ncbi:MAG: AarF/UbiB family protein, partial [Fusobacterium sp.]|nr:AarF/UbiB family protein [Fusobacterium sp.]
GGGGGEAFLLGYKGLNTEVPAHMSELRSGIRLLKPLSAGTVGETYLANQNGREVIVKMIKKNVDQEQLNLEHRIFMKFIDEFASTSDMAAEHKRMISNLYKDWAKELDFTYEYKYNKLLQQGAKRYKVADITKMSQDASCIIMEKADGVQMNNLMKMLKDFQENPVAYQARYAAEIEANPWLRNPNNVIEQLPDVITKAFDEMFLFMKKGGKSLMHGDPHMGNYFITENGSGKLIPMFIDTGNCVERNAAQIKKDLGFLTDYFVGNSSGLARYFVAQCERVGQTGAINQFPCRALVNNGVYSSKTLDKEALINKISQEIQSVIFDKRHNVTDVDAVQKTIRIILERNGLRMKPESITALKAQMQFFTGITEAASLSGRTINVGTIVKDIPQALFNMVRHGQNPYSSVKSAVKYAYNNQVQATNVISQFVSEKPGFYIEIVNTPHTMDFPVCHFRA